jgi:hypothetical protein
VTNGASKSLADPKPTPAQASQPTSQPAMSTQPPVDLPLIDLFGSLSDNQQTMAQDTQQYPQQPGFQQPGFQIPQQTANMGFQQQQQAFNPQSAPSTNPFAHMQQPMQQQMQPPMQQSMQQQPPQLQTQFTGAGFGGYTQQSFSPQTSLPPIPQNGLPDFSQQQQPLQPQPTSTNPFRQSMLPPQATGLAEPKMLGNPTGASSPLGRSATNPFAKQNTGLQSSLSPPGSSPFSVPSIQSPQQNLSFAPQQGIQPLQPSPTGTNPFARNASPIQGPLSPQGGLTVHATGSTNPFRQSQFVNQQTGQGWQAGGQGMLGGMSVDQVPTTSVFPRPGQQPQQSQAPNFLG